MRLMMHWRILVGLSLGALGSVVAAAQDPGQVRRSQLADSSVPAIMAARRGGRFPTQVVLDVLRQRGGDVPVTKRNELADSVIALALRTPGAGSAVAAIGSAGVVEPGSVADPRALDWLIRIHREAGDEGTRSSALEEMLRQPDHQRVFSYLRGVVTGPGPDITAWLAMNLLLGIATDRIGFSPAERQQVMTDLREMWDRRLVTNPSALSQLRDFAAVRRWRRPPGG